MRQILQSVFYVATIVTICLQGSRIQAAETYTYRDLVKRLTDMELLAVPAQSGERTAMASSYDRQSRIDTATKRFLQWDANGDGAGFIRKEGNQIVMADIQGPGCIWRIWSATPGEGHVKIFLDGSESPTIDMPFRAYFDRHAAESPFVFPNLVYPAAGEKTETTPSVPGANNYVPIPFQKSCKIVAEPGWGMYYHFNYTQFPEGTRLPTFGTKLSSDDAAALAEADQILGRRGIHLATARPGEKTENHHLTAPAGQRATVVEMSGPQAITLLKVKTGLPQGAGQQRSLLRQLTVQITWDDEKTPAVWAPLGDFFGYIGGAGAYQTQPVGLLDDGTFYSCWYMPFGHKAKIEVANDGGQPIDMDWEITHAPLSRPADTLMRFHAKWHRDVFLPQEKERAIDWTLVTTQGCGRFVGVMLHVWCANGGWWGEGDEKFFVDGEDFPSTFGTGAEDYFGYAWGSPLRFVRPYHAQPICDLNSGHIDNARWHISDSVPFQKSFEGCLEKYFPNDHPALYAATACWYITPGGVDPYGVVDVDQRAGYDVMPAFKSEEGAIEAETMRDRRPGRYWPSIDWGDCYSGHRALQWSSGEKAETLELGFPMEKSGSYHVCLNVLKNGISGIFQFRLNKEPLGDPVDLFSENPHFEILDMGVHKITAGEPALQIEVVGKNPAVTDSQFPVTIDYVKLTPVE